MGPLKLVIVAIVPMDYSGSGKSKLITDNVSVDIYISMLTTISLADTPSPLHSG